MKSALRRSSGVCLALLLALTGAIAQARPGDSGERGRDDNRPHQHEYPRTPALAPGGLRHRDWPEQPVRNSDTRRPGSHPDQYQRYEQAPRPERPVNDVIRQVERNYGGKVVGVRQEGSNYRVRVLQRDGRVRTVMMPAQ